MFFLKRVLMCTIVFGYVFSQSEIDGLKIPYELKNLKNNPSVENLLKNNKQNIDTYKSGQNELKKILSNDDNNRKNKDLLKKVNDQLDDITAVNIEDSQNQSDDNSIKGLDNNDKNKSKGLENLKKATPSNSNYFGYDIFQSNPDFFQKSNSDILDPDYTIGPGDEIIILLWGQTEFQESHVVTKEGYIFIENLGQVFVNGLNLEKLENKLFKLLSKVYSSMISTNGNASTFLDVSLGALTLRSVRIFVLGEVSQPGAYMIRPNSTLFTSLYYFNGPTIDGSLREIVLIRSNKELVKIDFYDFLLKGKQNNDIRLRRDDVIFIPKRGKTVSLIGEIKKPLIYEMKKNENFKDLISMAGGLKSTTYMNHAQIMRIIPAGQRNESGIDRTIVDIDLKKINDSNSFELFNDDEITFFKISDVISNSVTINGAVERPGNYEVGNGLKVEDLIKKSNGLLGTAYLEKADVSRKNLDNSIDYIEINLRKAIDGDAEHNIRLKSGDIINVYDHFDMKYRSDVEISGHVLNPKRFEFKNGMTVSDLIFLGGGFQNEDFLVYTYMEKAELRRKIDNSLEKELVFFRLDSVLAGKGLADEKLKMGDHIHIYSMDDVRNKIPSKVSIEGFVMRPGLYDLYSKMTLKDLLHQAGGIKDSVITSKTYFQRFDLFRKNILTDEIKIISLDLFDDSAKNLELKGGDIVRIYSKGLFDPPKIVSIDGIVKDPGDFDFKEDMTIYDLILDAGGLVDGIIDFRADITRKSQNSLVLKNDIITLDLKNDKSMIDPNKKEKLKENYFLEPQDFVTLRKKKNSDGFNRAIIEGFVNYPGIYVLKNSNEKISDLINRAGGISDGAYLRASYFIRNDKKINLSFEKILKYPNSKSNFTVANNDVIHIGTKSEIVEIKGEVNSPGFYQFLSGQRFDDYVKISGGYTSNASRLSSYVINPDGKTKKVKILSGYPRVYDGSVIIVGRKEDTIPFNITDYLATVTSIYAELTQAYLMLKLLALNN